VNLFQAVGSGAHVRTCRINGGMVEPTEKDETYAGGLNERKKKVEPFFFIMFDKQKLLYSRFIFET
jgi:hypothetical protein